jgi:hypothetical protein
MTFIDVAEMAKMQSQSWFQSFTDTLKRGGKLFLNLPFIKYEQTAAPKSFSEQDAFKFAKQIFQKIQTHSVQGVKTLIEEE